MSDIPADWREQLDLRGVIAGIDRDRAEAQKFAAEQRKLIAEAEKLSRDRWLAPWVIGATLFSGAVAGVVVAVINHVWH